VATRVAAVVEVGSHGNAVGLNCDGGEPTGCSDVEREFWCDQQRQSKWVP